MPRNGHYQLDRRPDPLLDASVLAVDTETTGSSFRVPYTHFDDPAIRFDCPARPYLITARSVQSEHHWRWQVDLRTRQVHIKRRDLLDLYELMDVYDTFVFHNSLFDLTGLALAAEDCQADPPWAAVPDFWNRLHDTLASAHVLDSSENHELDALAVKYLGILDTDKQILRERVEKARMEAKRRGIPRGPAITTDYFLPYELTGDDCDLTYGLNDVKKTFLLRKMHVRELHKQNLLRHYERERQIIRHTFFLMWNGVDLRPDVLTHDVRLYAQTSRRHEDACQEIAGTWGRGNVNIRSHPQKTDLLYKQLNLPPQKLTPKGSPSTDAESLGILQMVASDIHTSRRIRPQWASLGFPTKQRLPKREAQFWQNVSAFLDNLLAYQVNQTGSNYLQGYVDRAVPGSRGRLKLHPRFNPWGQAEAGMATTRFSSSDPNGQNVGKDARLPLRRVFGPPKGWIWICMDFDQLELRLMAHASGDDTLKRILAEGLDRHQMTADLLKVPRGQGKNINFAWQYGAGAGKLSRMAGLDAHDFRESMRSLYPGVVGFMEETISDIRNMARRRQHPHVCTMFGYPLSVPPSEAYKGVNYIIQGTAGDILKNSMIAVNEYIESEDIGDRIHMILTIHDELVFQCRRRMSRRHLRNIFSIMSSAGDPIGCDTPVSASICDETWASPKPLTLLPLPLAST